MEFELNGVLYSINPQTTDLHVSNLAQTFIGSANGYIGLDRWAMAAKLLCFIFGEPEEAVFSCDFAEYDPVTKDGELYVTVSDMQFILEQLKSYIAETTTTKAETYEKLLEEYDAIKLQLEALQPV